MEIQIFFIHFSYIQMIAEFNSYMSNIDIDFFKELCLKHGELRHYKKNEFILHEGDACSFFGFILSGVVKYSCTNRTENKPYNVGFSFPNEFYSRLSHLLIWHEIRIEYTGDNPVRDLHLFFYILTAKIQGK